MNRKTLDQQEFKGIWVSVGVALPPEWNIVLAWQPSLTGWQVKTLRCEKNGDWFDNDDHLIEGVVTHWMPLPHLPNTE